MIFPLKDDVPSRSWPIVTVALVALNVLAFLYQLSLGIDARGPGAGAAQAFVAEFGVIPCRLTALCPVSQRVTSTPGPSRDWRAAVSPTLAGLPRWPRTARRGRARK